MTSEQCGNVAWWSITGVPQSHVWPRVCEFGRTESPPSGWPVWDRYFICAPLFVGQMQ